MMTTLPRPPRLLADVRTAVTMPRLDVVASRGEPPEDEVLRFLRRPHPRYRIVGSKVVGAYRSESSAVAADRCAHAVD